MKRFIYFILILFLAGCNSKQKVGYFDTQKSEQQAIINTKKAQFLINDKRFLLTGTYLNPIKSLKFTNHEAFLITIYSSNLKNSDNLITGAMLNKSVKDINWKPLNANDPLTKFSPIANRWNHYFLVKTPQIKSNNLNLILQIHKRQRVVLDFEKSLLD